MKKHYTSYMENLESRQLLAGEDMGGEAAAHHCVGCGLPVEPVEFCSNSQIESELAKRLPELRQAWLEEFKLNQTQPVIEQGPSWLSQQWDSVHQQGSAFIAWADNPAATDSIMKWTFWTGVGTVGHAVAALKMAPGKDGPGDYEASTTTKVTLGVVMSGITAADSVYHDEGPLKTFGKQILGIGANSVVFKTIQKGGPLAEKALFKTIEFGSSGFSYVKAGVTKFAAKLPVVGKYFAPDTVTKTVTKGSFAKTPPTITSSGASTFTATSGSHTPVYGSPVPTESTASDLASSTEFTHLDGIDS